jgi:hypothetical protein
LTLYAAHAISDCGSIVASSNAGLVLLVPAGAHTGGQTIGPIISADLVKVGAAFDASVSIAGEDRAGFSFLAPSARGANAQLYFNIGGLNFRSKDMRALGMQGARGQFAGSGTINGAGDYQFTMDAAAGAEGRFGLKIWHTDAATGAEVVDYDSQGKVGETTGRRLVEGAIANQLSGGERK